MRLILIRHPKPLCEKGICYGRLDLECEPHALSEAVRRLGKMARAARLHKPCKGRARALASRLGAQLIVDERLQELDFGEWEGRRWQDLGREAIGAWSQGLPDSAPPNGETLTALAAMRLMARKPSAQRKPDPRHYPCRPDPSRSRDP
jgi:alpha-ribazole phosphatase